MLFPSRQGNVISKITQNANILTSEFFYWKLSTKKEKLIVTNIWIYCPNTRYFSSAVCNRARFRESESMCSTTCFDSVYRSRRAAPRRVRYIRTPSRRYHSVPIWDQRGEVVRGSRLGFHQQTLPPPCRHHFAAIINFSHKH